MPNPLPPGPPRRYLSPDDIAWLEQGVAEGRKEWDRVRRHGSPEEKAWVLGSLSGQVCDLEGPAVALRLSRRAHRLWRTAGNPEAIAVSGAVLAVRLLDAGHLEEGLRQAAEAREAMLRLDRTPHLNSVMAGIGRELLWAGHATEAQAWLETATEAMEGDQLADTLEHLSRALELQGWIPKALQCQEEVCRLRHLQHERIALASAMLRLARLHMRLNRQWQAANLCIEAMKLLRRRNGARELALAQELHRLCRPNRPSLPRGH